MREMVLLADVKSGFHFLAMKTGYSQLKNAEMRKMAKKMEESAPNVWGLLSVLLSADPKRTYSREWAREKVTAANLKKARMPLAPPTSDVEMGHPASKNSELEGNGFKEDDYFRYFDDILFDEDEDVEQAGMPVQRTALTRTAHAARAMTDKSSQGSL